MYEICFRKNTNTAKCFVVAWQWHTLHLDWLEAIIAFCEFQTFMPSEQIVESNNLIFFIKVVRREMNLTALSIWCQTSGFFYGGILLPPVWKINYVNMQHNYVDMRPIYANTKHNNVDMQHNHVNMRGNYVYKRIELSWKYTYTCK